MINENKWLNSLPKTNQEFSKTSNHLDNDRWTNTIPKVKNYSSTKKYFFLTAFFVFGLLLVSVVKNETRSLQKEINNLEASIDKIKFNLDQAILDHEVLTSPEHISLLAKEYLNIDLVPYKSSQIKHINDEHTKFTEVSKIKKEKKISSSIKKQVAKKIRKKKTEIRKLQELYSNPETIPDEIKTHVAVKIKEKKTELKNIYSSPTNVFTLERVGRWSVIQVVKLFLGMPIIPGR